MHVFGLLYLDIVNTCRCLLLHMHVHTQNFLIVDDKRSFSAKSQEVEKLKQKSNVCIENFDI